MTCENLRGEEESEEKGEDGGTHDGCESRLKVSLMKADGSVSKIV